jgi:hypothetical protein
MTRKSIFAIALCLLGAMATAKAQAQYAAEPYRQLSLQRPQAVDRGAATLPSWSYDPYTSGLGPCPQHSPNDSLSCSEQLPPTYGQPSYWSR